MRFNGVDVLTVHYALPSIDKEIPPGGPARNITTVESSGGDMVTSADVTQDEYTLRINMAARTYDEAMLAREALAAWAMSSGNQTAELEPTHMPGKAYAAICKSVGRVENRFAPIDVAFMLPKPILHSVVESRASGTSQLTLQIGGTAPVQPVIVFAASAAASGLTISVDGKAFYAIKRQIYAGNEVTIQPETGAVLVNGFAASDSIDYTNSNPDVELTPGKHVIAASVAGTLTARWHNQWL